MHDHFAERIKWCKEMRDAATEQLRRIEEGWQFLTRIGSGPEQDVTESIAERERQVVDNMTRLIEGYEARDA